MPKVGRWSTHRSAKIMKAANQRLKVSCVAFQYEHDKHSFP